MKNILCWTDIPVADLDRAIAFYSAVLGAAVAKQTAESGDTYGLLPWSEGVVSGCLVATPDNAPSAKGPLIYLSVEGRLDGAIAAVSAKGGRVVQAKHQIGPHGFRTVVFDSEGNRLALHSMKS
jgi:hypothetical protein